MTNEEAEELGRRAMACEGWRVMEGVRHTDGSRVVDILMDGYIVVRVVRRLHNPLYNPSQYRDHFNPDFRDPATLGCLLARVREVTGDLMLDSQNRHFVEPADLVRMLEAAE